MLAPIQRRMEQDHALQKRPRPIGITAGFWEEVLFRAFLMTQFAQRWLWKGNSGPLPGVAFGLSHGAYFNQGFLPWLGIMVGTAVVGMVWGIAYLLGRRSLVPTLSLTS